MRSEGGSKRFVGLKSYQAPKNRALNSQYWFSIIKSSMLFKLSLP